MNKSTSMPHKVVLLLGWLHCLWIPIQKILQSILSMPLLTEVWTSNKLVIIISKWQLSALEGNIRGNTNLAFILIVMLCINLYIIDWYQLKETNIFPMRSNSHRLNVCLCAMKDEEKGIYLYTRYILMYVSCHKFIVLYKYLTRAWSSKRS